MTEFQKRTILLLYKTLTDHKIANILGLNHTKVGRWRRSLGIESVYKPKVSDIVKHISYNNLIDYWKNGLSNAKIAKLLKTNHTTLKKYMRLNNVIKPKKYIRRKGNPLYKVNENFFENIDTEQKAYILGFWAADGWMNDRALWIAISVKDINHLKKIKNTIPTEAPIIIKEKKSKFKRNKLAFLALTRKKMRQDVAALGFSQQKGKFMIFPDIPKELYRHYIRGFWDGDGYIGPSQFSIVGQRTSFFKTLQKIILNETKCKLVLRFVHHKSPSLVGNRRDIDAINWLYKDNQLVLDRKYQLYLKYWTK